MKQVFILFSACICFLFMTDLKAQWNGEKIELSPSRSIEDSRFTVTATVMDDDTWCRVEWPDPVGNPMELWYDDNEADDYFIWADSGNMNALKFISFFDNFIVTGGRIHVGDGSFPGPFLGTLFRVLVYDDDGDDGLPGTVLDSTDVLVNNYGWVEFEGLTAQFAEGNFYLVMKQLAPSPDAAPVGVDTDNPTYFRSYIKFNDSTWLLSPLQDFMIRAYITAYNEPARAIDSFEVARFSGFDYEESPLLGDTTILDTINLSEYNDLAWDTLTPGLFAYGVKTHFTSGEWSDYDVSNLVMHIFYPFPPTCFFQADTGNRPLIICPPSDLNGALPNWFLGFNVYVNGSLDNYLPPTATSYLPSVVQPGIYTCGLTAVYDLSFIGYPNETMESSALTTPYTLRFGHPLPFLEQWNLGTFETNNWLTEGENWSINWQEGQPGPSAEFTWDPIQTDYEISFESYPLLADSLSVGQIWLDFDLKLDNYLPTGTEQLLVKVWNWETMVWTTVSTYSNEDGSFDWVSEHFDITNQALEKVFRIRFTAFGENSLNIVGWYVDNIHVYRDCQAPENLQVWMSMDPFGTVLEWDPIGQSNMWLEWDDGIWSENSIGTGQELEFDVAARWEPPQLSDFNGYLITKVRFLPAEAMAEYRIRVWIGAGASNMILDQLVENPIIDQWNDIPLNQPVNIDIMQELWVGYHVNAQTGYPAGVDNGPAIDGYGNMMNFGGWQTLLEINDQLNYNWNIAAFLEPPDLISNPDLYAIYRQIDFEPFTFRAFIDSNYYVDDFCEQNTPRSYKVSALYYDNLDTCESGFSNEDGILCWLDTDEYEDITCMIYPNPTTDVLFIETKEKIESISIFDSRGITVELWNPGTVKQERGGQVVGWSGGQVEVSLEGLAPGLYLVRVETGRGVVGRKVVIR